MTQALATKNNNRLSVKWIALPVLGTALALGGYWTYTSFAGSDSGSGMNVSSFKTVPVRLDNMEIRVNVKGELQATDNIDIVCQVEGGTTITQIVPEGTNIKKGDTIALLDSSAIRQKLDDVKIDLERATSDLTAAKEMLEIQRSKNDTDLEAAEVALQVAQLDLKKFTDGTYPQQEADAQMALEKANITLKSKEDDLQQTRSLFAKGFVTSTEVKNREIDVASAKQDLEKAETELKVLRRYAHEMDLTTKKNTLAQGEAKVERTKRENASNLSQKDADVRAKDQALAIIQRKKDKLEFQLNACTIKAPDDGMVVYVNGGGDRDRQPIQEGAGVRERQVIMRLPDTKEMKVVLRVGENAVSRLSIGQPASVTLATSSNPMQGKVTRISPVSDSAGKWWDPDRKEYPVDIVLDHTPPGLKPNVTADVSVMTNRVENASIMPIAALYSAGNDRYAFVLEGNQPRVAKIHIDQMNDQDIQVTDGLNPGDNVILLEPGMGKSLLERAGIKIEPTSKPSDNTPGGMGNKSKRKGPPKE